MTPDVAKIAALQADLIATIARQRVLLGAARLKMAAIAADREMTDDERTERLADGIILICLTEFMLRATIDAWPAGEEMSARLRAFNGDVHDMSALRN